MKGKIAVTVALVVVQIFLAATPFIPLTAQFWRAESPEDFYSKLSGFIALQLVLFSSALCLLFILSARDDREGFAALAERFPGSVVRRLPDREFYLQFELAVKEARHSVRIAYFAPYPPDEVNDKQRKAYYKRMERLMKKRGEISFKRVVRASERNDAWVGSLLQQFRNRPNIDIAMLKKDLAGTVEMPLALSVQVVDDSRVWFVAARSHETRGEFRDVYVENAELGAAMTDYYDRIWGHSELLLDRGRVTPAGQQFLRNSNGVSLDHDA